MAPLSLQRTLTRRCSTIDRIAKTVRSSARRNDSSDSGSVYRVLDPSLVPRLRLRETASEKRIMTDLDQIPHLKRHLPPRWKAFWTETTRLISVTALLIASCGITPGRTVAMPEVNETPTTEINTDDDDEKAKAKAKEESKPRTSVKKKRSRQEAAKERAAKRKERERALKKKGKKIDPYQSMVPNPDDVPDPESDEVKKVMSAWRVEKLRELTYTQLWQLIRDGHIERVRYRADERTMQVWVKESAPGGARQCKVGIPYDPDLLPHMMANKVFIEAEEENPTLTVLYMMVRLAIPFICSYALIQFSFRVGQKDDDDDPFVGATLEMLSSSKSRMTFNDIAGIDQVKFEIKEVIAFLKNPEKFTKLGARTPGGLLLVGPPGTGKTLLARAIAGESGVPFFSTAGSEFSEMYVGVGASRVRDMFQTAREAAPCILFIDEFDAIGQKRSEEGTDESVNTVNQLLTELDGFEDNTGVVVIAATNRPNTLDMALTRPGRFDRVIHLPYPNLEGREEIIRVHARGKTFSDEVDFSRIARATAGFTGAQLMYLINESATTAVQHRRGYVDEQDLFEALEKMLTEKREDNQRIGGYDMDIIPAQLRKNIAVYEAGKAMIALMTPDFDEIFKISVCAKNVPTGATFFLPREEQLESRVVSRGYMESKLVVFLAGRCSERMLLGDANISTAGAADINAANAVAKEMIYRCGFSKQLGPVSLMDNEDSYIAAAYRTRPVANISTDLARIAFEECRELLDAAEAKAYYGIATNFPILESLIEELVEKTIIGRPEYIKILERHKFVEFESPFVDGYGWDDDGRLIFPDDGRPKSRVGDIKGRYPFSSLRRLGIDSWWDPANPYKMRWDFNELLEKKFSSESTDEVFET